MQDIHGTGGTLFAASRAIGIALWEFLGKQLSVPIYKLLGGNVYPRLPIYTIYRWGNIPRTAAACARRTKALIERGATAGKWDPFMEPLALFFLEEPVPPESVDAMAILWRSTGAPLEFQRTVPKTGGPHHPARRRARRRHDGSIRIATPIPNLVIMEDGNDQTAEYKDILKGGWKTPLSHWEIPEAPGLGVNLSPQFLKDHRTGARGRRRLLANSAAFVVAVSDAWLMGCICRSAAPIKGA